MRFSPIYMAFLVTSALASPAPAAVPDPVPNTQMSVRSVADINHIAETNIDGVDLAKCKLLQCITIIDTASCVYDAGFDLDLTLACVGGDAEAVSTIPSTFSSVGGSFKVKAIADSSVSCAIVPGVTRS
jgi:hypothetical protein